jgi:hypothetical protein
MTYKPLFESVSPFQSDVLALPVDDIDVAVQWYASAIGMLEIGRRDTPYPSVVRAR